MGLTRRLGMLPPLGCLAPYVLKPYQLFMLIKTWILSPQSADAFSKLLLIIIFYLFLFNFIYSFIEFLQVSLRYKIVC